MQPRILVRAFILILVVDLNIITWSQAGMSPRNTSIVRYINSLVPWRLYMLPIVQRLEVKIINSLFFKFPFLKKNNKFTSSPVVSYGNVRGYDTGCFTLWYTKQEQCGYRMIATNFVPESASLVNVRYYLWNAVHTEKFIDGSTDLTTVTVDATQPVRIIVHGMQENETDTSLREIQKALKASYPKENVFLVAWDGNYIGSDTQETGVFRWYGQAAANTELVGRIIGNFMRELEVSKPGTMTDITQIHCIGFSLGAQTCGHAGNWVNRMFGKKLGRISALDAANPLFSDKVTGDYKYDVRVGPSDASFVDAYHSSGAKMVLRGAGDYERYGHVDFYPNGGVQQPGCPSNWLQAGIEYAKGTGSEDFACSHSRAANLYADTIYTNRSTCKFIADKCSNWETYDRGECWEDPCASSSSKCVEMGYYATKKYYPNADGVYYIKTFPQPYRTTTGYCAALFRVTVVVSSSHQRTKGRLQLRAWPSDATKISSIAWFNSGSEKIEPGSTQYAIVAAYSEAITNIEIKFSYQQYLGYWKYKKQSWMQTKDKTIKIDSVTLRNRGGTKTYVACGVTSGTEVNSAGKTFSLATTC